MLVCLNQRTGEGCGALNDTHAQQCHECGMPLRFALQLHNTVVQDRYRIIRGIGSGRFGAVYQAEDLRSAGNPLVALKESFDPANIRIFRREFHALQYLGHPNLPHYYEMFETEGSGYLVMEYVPGQSLLDILNRRSEPLPESLVKSYMWQVCDVLFYLHSQATPIFHRDIKPSNIRLTPEGLIKLVDFGIAKRGMPNDLTTVSGFSPGYAAPEQLVSGGGTGPRTDIYGLGATLYHLLTGKVPPSAIERITALPDTLPPPRSINPHVSLSISYVVVSAMSLNETGRYADIASFRKVLFGEEAPMVSVEPENATRVVEVDHQEEIGSYNIAWSPDGTLLAGAYYTGNCVLWDIRSGDIQRIDTRGKYVWGLAFSPHGNMLAAASEGFKVQLWQVDDGTLIQTFNGHTQEVWRVAFSPDGLQLASASWDTTIKLWCLEKQQLIHTFQGHESGVVDIAFGPFGKRIASSSRDGTVRLWDVNEKTLIHTLHGHEGTVYSVAYSPDAEIIASVSHDATIKLWQSEDGELLRTLEGHDGPVIDVAFSPDGRILATSSKDKTVKLWNAKDGTLLHTLHGHTDTVSSVAFSPDGQKIASAAQDYTVRLWGVW